MGIFTPFRNPQDTRWSPGPQRHHHSIFLLKTLLLIPFVILIIVESTLFKSWSHRDTWTHAPHNFWLRIGLALVPDVIYTLVAILLILNPMHRAVYSLHPVFALVGSVVLVCLYIQVCWLGPFLAYANEVAFDNVDVWKALVYLETAFEGLLGLMWVMIMAYSAVAVKRWREGRKRVFEGRV